VKPLWAQLSSSYAFQNLLCANTFGLSDKGLLGSSLRDHATFFKSQHIPVVRSDRPRPICMLGSTRNSAGGICTTGRLNIEASIISQNRIWKMAQECSDRLHWMSLDDCPCWRLDHKYLRRSPVDKNQIILSSFSQLCRLPKKHHK
jgi:hypothetical protein